MRNQNPFKDLKLDAEERKIERGIEAGEWKPVKNLKKEMQRYQSYARYTLEKSKNINLRLSHADLLRIRAKAVAEGIPYQTLIGSILHKYATQ